MLLLLLVVIGCILRCHVLLLQGVYGRGGWGGRPTKGVRRWLLLLLLLVWKVLRGWWLGGGVQRRGPGEWPWIRYHRGAASSSTCVQGQGPHESSMCVCVQGQGPHESST